MLGLQPGGWLVSCAVDVARGHAPKCRRRSKIPPGRGLRGCNGPAPTGLLGDCATGIEGVDDFEVQFTPRRGGYQRRSTRDCALRIASFVRFAAEERGEVRAQAGHASKAADQDQLRHAREIDLRLRRGLPTHGLGGLEQWLREGFDERAFQPGRRRAGHAQDGGQERQADVHRLNAGQADACVLALLAHQSVANAVLQDEVLA